MADCERCGATDELVHTCNHCKAKFCPEHTLPENHRCPALRTDAVGAGEYNIQSSNETDDRSNEGAERSQRDVDNSPDFESGPDVATDGSVANKREEDNSGSGGNRHTVVRAVSSLKRGLVGGFVSPQYRGQCPICDQYVSERVRTDAAGIPCCKNCGWMPGYPILRRLTHRFNWHDWRRRATKSVKLTLVVIAVLGFAAVFGTGIAPIDNTADSVAKFAGLDDDTDRASEVAASVANSSSESSETATSQNNLAVDERRVETLVHQYINQERQEQGLATLGHEQQLRYIAKNHSEDMANRSYFSHEDLSGDGFSDRYSEAGYNCEVEISQNRYATGGENIAQTWYRKQIDMGGSGRYYDSADELARGIVTQWMNSPGHRENILRDYWQSEGIGIEITESGKVFATQNFC